MIRLDELEDERLRKAIVQQSEPTAGVVWWYKWGGLLFSAVAIFGIWFFVIRPNEFTPKTDMVQPATVVLEKGIKQGAPIKVVSKQLDIPVQTPDLRQLGGKLKTSSAAEFGGVKAVLMDYQYGKSEFLLYRFQEPSKLFEKMKKPVVKGRQFFVSSEGAVSVVAWQDKKSGYWALAAKATEKDLLGLADKMAATVKA